MKALKIFTIVIGSILAIVVAAGSVHYYQCCIDYRFTEVTDGRVYRSAAMPYERLQERVGKHGIRSVVDLRWADATPDEEKTALDAVGVRYFHVPSAQRPSDRVVERFLRIMEDESNYPVLIHCTHGESRAPLFSAIYRIEIEGWEPDVARRKAKWFANYGTFGKSGEKGRYLLGYDPRRRPTSGEDFGNDPAPILPSSTEGSASD